MRRSMPPAVCAGTRLGPIMSKRGVEGAFNGEFWKKMKYGAATAITVGSGIYAATSVLNKRGAIADVVESGRVALQSPPGTQNDATECIDRAGPNNMKTDNMLPTKMLTDKMPPSDPEEARAVLDLHLQFAMQRQDKPRVQELSRELSRKINDLALTGAPTETSRRLTSKINDLALTGALT